MASRLSIAGVVRSVALGTWVLLAGLMPMADAAAQTAAEEKQKDKRKASPSTSEPQQKEERPKDDHIGFRWEGYPSLHFGKGSHLDFRARVQLDVRGADSPANDSDDAESDFARRRIAFEGELAGVVAFQVERELEEEGSWRDVYANYRQFDVVQVQGGKFKLPFSMDENTSPTNLDFVYRSLAARILAPGRDRGVMVHGRVLDRIVRYEIGAFDHDGLNARTDNPERVFGDSALAGRLAVQPFRSSKSAAADLQVGVAFTSSEVPLGVRSLRGRTTFEETFFDPDLWVQGKRRRTGLEFRWRPGPFSIKSEYMRVTTERLGQSVEDTDLSPLLATGWYVSGTWAITGEKKANSLNKPRRPFMRGGFGAVEAAFRVEQISFGSVASEDSASRSARADVVERSDNRVVTAGANWYLNQWVKIQLNAIKERIGNARRGVFTSDGSSWTYAMRFQFTL
jgi:phosphate-selective porin OprO and OprP